MLSGDMGFPRGPTGDMAGFGDDAGPMERGETRADMGGEVRCPFSCPVLSDRPASRAVGI
jgi:hypothetical protein